MGCKDCAERRKNLRDAIMHGKMAEALDITVDGLRAMIRVDADADHRKVAMVGEGAPEVITADEPARPAKRGR